MRKVGDCFAGQKIVHYDFSDKSFTLFEPQDGKMQADEFSLVATPELVEKLSQVSLKADNWLARVFVAKAENEFVRKSCEWQKAELVEYSPIHGNFGLVGGYIKANNCEMWWRIEDNDEPTVFRITHLNRELLGS